MSFWVALVNLTTVNKPLPEFANECVKVLLLNVIVVIETDLYYMHENVIKNLVAYLLSLHVVSN